MPMDPTTPFNPPAMPPAPLLHTSRLRWAARLAKLLLGLVITVWVLMGATWGLLHGWIVPRIEDFRPRLEQEASRAMGMPVRIGQITARSNGLMPSFEVRDVLLLDAAGHVALQLPQVLAALSPSSLWGGGFEQLVLDQPTLEIRRARDGKIYVGGVDVLQSRSDTSYSTDWIFSQTELAIRGGSVRWVDELRGAPPLALRQVDAVLRNGRRSHQMRLDATPPPEWGDRFTLRGMFRQPLLATHAGRWSDWTGQLFAEFGRMDVSQLKNYASLAPLGIDLKTGQGSLRAWADVTDGQVLGATADVALVGVDVRLGEGLESLQLDALSGRLGGRQLANGFEVSTEKLGFKTSDGAVWPGGNVAVSFSAREGAIPQQATLSADRLDLAAVAQIANRLPLDATTRNLIQSYAPKGLVETVQARWQGPTAQPVSLSAKGRVTGLSVQALPSASVTIGTTTVEPPGRPGIRNASVDFELTQSGGKASVKVAAGALDLPGVFEDPSVPFDQLALDAQWTLTAGKVDAQFRNITFANADAQGQGRASWRSSAVAATSSANTSHTNKPGTDNRPPEGTLGVLDLQGSLSRGNGASVHRYLPLVLLPRVRHYVRDAVVKGDVSDVTFSVKGAVDRIPYSNPQLGDFKVSAKVKNGTLNFVPASVLPPGAVQWPALTDLNGELVFDRASLAVVGASGRLVNTPNVEIVKADARIDDLLHDATVQVNLTARGPAAEALGFVNTSPLAGLTGRVLDKAVVTGTGQYTVGLKLPLFALDKSQVQGSVTLAASDLQWTPATPVLSRIKGVLNFSETSFNMAGVQARLLGGDVRLDGSWRAAPRVAATAANPSPDAEPQVNFKAQGTLTSDGLRQARELGVLSRLAQNASGSAAYNASVTMRRGVPEIVFTSTLQGMTLSLPAPLVKAADSALPVRYESALVRESLSAGQKLQDQQQLSLGRLASVVYVRDISGEQPRVIRGGISVGLEPGESVPLPDSGVAANINVVSVDLDAWGKVLTATTNAAVNVSTSSPTSITSITSSAIGTATNTLASTAAPSAPAARPAAAEAMAYLPTQMAIRAKELLVGGRRLNRVVVGGSRDGLDWRANVDAEELNGYVEFRQPGGSGAGSVAGRVFARLARLNLGPTAAADVETLLDSQPASIPALDIVVEELELKGRKLGRIEIDAINRGALAVAREGGVREWRLNKFNVTVPEAVLTASGNWVAAGVQSGAPLQSVASGVKSTAAGAERRRTVMNFKLDIADSGALLKRFGMVDVIRRGKGKMDGQLSWLGTPLSPDYPSMVGLFNVNIESGQFLKADPGIAKLLGVLSLQALPRRLALDFRDVFSEGFAFDFVRGDVNINQGVAATNNLQMKGVNAAVLMDGSADIAKETQDLKVVVVPEINAGTASLIATVINPAIGLGTFLAQYFLRAPLIEANTQQFHIDGSWANPRITKVERKR